MINKQNDIAMTLQDLRNNRERVIEFAELNLVDVKDFMNKLVEWIQFQEWELEDLLDAVYETCFRTSSRKTSKVAEAAGRAKESGNYEFDMSKYYASKN